MNKESAAAPNARRCYASVMETAREIDREIGGRELARMPPECARLIVKLKRWIQDGDAAGIRDLECPPLDFAQKLTIAVGECIADQRNGMDVLASASWDRVCEGKLDAHGYWEHPCPECARSAEKTTGEPKNTNWPLEETE